MKFPSLLALLALCLVIPAEAAKKDGGAAKAAQERKKEKLAERAERTEKREAVEAVLDVKDKNGDGSLTLDEFLIGETDVEAANARFDEFNKNGDRYLSKKEIEATLGL